MLYSRRACTENLFINLIHHNIMAINYKLIERHNPKDYEAPAKFYAQVCNTVRVDIEALSRDISYSTTLTDVEVEGVTKALIEQITRHLAEGHSVSLGKLGTFYTTINSEGADTAEDFKTNMISKVNIRFLPSTTMKGKFNLSNVQLRRISSDGTAEDIVSEP